jgi:ATP-dependent RNA helicase SUPV3L1/SUV3
LSAEVSETGEACVAGTYVGRLDGLRFVPDANDGVEARVLIAAAGRVLRREVAIRADRLYRDTDDAFAIDPGGNLRWRGDPVGRLVAGERIHTPRAEPLAGDVIEGELREKIRQRLQAYLRTEIERRLTPLFRAQALPLGGVARGLVFQLVDALGSLPAAEVGQQVEALDAPDRAALSQIGLRFGIESIYFEPLLRVDTMRFRGLLWAVRENRPGQRLPPTRRLAKVVEIDPTLPTSFYTTAGLRVLGRLALRPDRLEKLAAATRRLARHGPFPASELVAISGINRQHLRGLLAALGYRTVVEAGKENFIARPRGWRGAVSGRSKLPADKGHPFAKLGELNLV